MSRIQAASGGQPNNNGNRLERYFGADRMAEQKTMQKEAPSLQEQVKAMKREVNAAQERVRFVANKLDEIEKSVGPSPKMAEIKQKNADIAASIQALNSEMLAVLLDEASIETVSAKVEAIGKDVASLDEPLFEEAGRAVEARAEKRQAASVAWTERLAEKPEEEIPTQPQAEEKAVVEPEAELTQPEMAVEEAAIEPAPVAETEHVAPAESYDRGAFWSELKQKLGDRKAASETQKKNQERLLEIDSELQQLQAKLEGAEQRGESTSALIDAMEAKHNELGGADHAAKVKAKLDKLTATALDREYFDRDWRNIELNPLKQDAGSEGVIRSLRVAKERAETAGSIDSVLNKMSKLIGLSEVQSLERQKRLLQAGIAQTLDSLIDRIQTENKINNLNKRKEAMEQAEQTIAVQVSFDRDLFAMVDTGEQLYKQERQAFDKLKQFALHLQNPKASDLLAEQLPTTLPEEARILMGVQEIQTYEALSARHAQLAEDLNAHIDKAKTFFEGGIATHQRRMVSESIEKSSQKLEKDLTTKADKPLEFSDRKPAEEDENEPRLAADDEDYLGAVNERMGQEFKKEKEELLERWEALTQIDLAEAIAEVHNNYSSGDDYFQFVSHRLNKEGQDQILEMNRLKHKLETVDSIAGLNAVLRKKQRMLNDFREFIKDESNLIPIPLEKPAAQTKENKAREDNAKIVQTAELRRAQKEMELSRAEHGDIEGYLPPTELESIKKENDKNWFYENLNTFIKTAHETFMNLPHRELLEHSAAWDMLGALEDIRNGKKDPMRMEATDRENTMRQALEVYKAMQGKAFKPDDADPAATAINAMADTLRVDLGSLPAEKPAPQPSSDGKTPRKLFRTPRRNAA